jgi:hypothetical protein
MMMVVAVGVLEVPEGLEPDGMASTVLDANAW